MLNVPATLLIVIAAILIGYDVSAKERSPWRMLLGLALLGGSIALRLLSAAALMPLLSGVLLDLGLGFLTLALTLQLNRKPAQSFWALAVLTLLGSMFLYQGPRFLGAVENWMAADTDGQPAESPYASYFLELGPDDTLDEVLPVLEAHNLTYEDAFPSIELTDDEDLAQVFLLHGYAADLASAAEALRLDVENVDYVARNRTIGLSPIAGEAVATSAARVANDPLLDQQWAMNAIGAAGAHDLLREVTPEQRARVAIVDTGVDAAHDELHSVYASGTGNKDLHGHGTHCAGIAGAVTNNGTGMASLNWEGRYVIVSGYAALSPSGYGTIESIAQAILDAARDDADVISMSLGDYAPIPPKVLVDAIEYAQKRGSIIVTSAGNSNMDARDHIPSNIDGVLVVAAVDSKLRKARFSNTNTSLNFPLAAPGVDILSLKPNNKYVAMSGTSMSTPLVSGLLGVMRALDPDLDTKTAYRILHETGTTLDDSPRIGRMINAEAALRALRPAVATD